MMKRTGRVASIRGALGRGIFPHKLSFFLELPWRHVALSPRRLAERLRLDADSRVLEVGAGSGFYSREIARSVPKGRLEVLDLQPEMLWKARRKLETEGLGNVGFALADAARLPFCRETFDALVLVAVLGEIDDERAFLSEARRILKPRGVLSISEHLPDPDFSSFAKLKPLIETEGFRCLKRFGGKWSYTANFGKRETG
jgi:uncharacterized protein